MMHMPPPMFDNISRQGTGMSVGQQPMFDLSRQGTGMSVGRQHGAGGDIQSQAPDIEGGNEPVFSGGPGTYPVLGFGFCAAKGKRPYNEDRVMLKPRLNGSRANEKLNFYGVLDGHGGARASEFAKNDLPNRLGQALGGRGLTQQEAPALFHDVFLQCDKAFLQQGATDGTTACTVLVSGTNVFCANVGDSEAMIVKMSAGMCRGEKISHTHKPSDASEANRIRNLGGTVKKIRGVVRVNDDLSVSRAIGDAKFKQFIVPDPTVTCTSIDKDCEYLVIGSDGLWDVTGPNAAAMLVHRSGNAKVAARRLVETALNAGTTDNVGVVVVDLRHIWDPSPPPPPLESGCCSIM